MLWSLGSCPPPPRFGGLRSSVRDTPLGVTAQLPGEESTCWRLSPCCWTVEQRRTVYSAPAGDHSPREVSNLDQVVFRAGRDVTEGDRIASREHLRGARPARR